MPARVPVSIGGLLLLSIGCAAPQPSSADAEVQAGAAPTAAEAPPDAFPGRGVDSSRDGDREMDELASVEAELDRYEAQLWRAGVPVGAYAQRGEAEKVGESPVEADEERSKENRDVAADTTSPDPAGKTPRPKAKAAKKGKPGKAAGAGYELGDASKDANGEQDRCRTVCELATAICELEARICDMADRHPESPRYRDACERASEDCRVASDACQQCSSG